MLTELGERFAPMFVRRTGGFTIALSANEAAILPVEYATDSTTAATFPVDEIANRLADLCAGSKVKPRGGMIRLMSGRFVLRPLSPLFLPASRLEAAAALDLGASTPFKPDLVKILPVSGVGRASTYAIVKHTVLDPVLAAFRHNGLTIAGIEFETADGTLRLALSARRAFTGGRAVWQARLFIVAIVAIVLATAATGVHVWLRNNAALGVVSAAVEALTRDAKTARQALDRHAEALAELAALRKNIEDTEPATTVWEELARVLPDSAYLTDLSVKGGEVSISGYAGQAAALVVALEQSPLFSKVDFTAPVIKTPGIDGERFLISLAAGD